LTNEESINNQLIVILFTAIPRSKVVTTEPISDAVTTVKTASAFLTTVTNGPDEPIIQTTIDAITTKEPTTHATALTPNVVETTISTAQDTQLKSTTSTVTQTQGCQEKAVS
ncbi:hypothetical protein AM593_00102, partial [Mytilus galloprovincialis]